MKSRKTSPVLYIKNMKRLQGVFNKHPVAVWTFEECERLAPYILRAILPKKAFLSIVDSEDLWTSEGADDAYLDRTDILKELTASMVGISMTDSSNIAEICTLIAGWRDSLLTRTHYIPWNGDRPIWSLIFFADIMKIPDSSVRSHYILVKSIGGISVGMRWKIRITGACAQQWIRSAGMPKYDKYCDEDLSGFVAWCRIGFVKGSFSILEVESTSGGTRLNRALMAGRSEKCTGPFETFRGKRKCGACPIGRDDCRFSRFSQGFPVIRDCVNGHKGYFRYDGEENYCLFCRLENRCTNSNKK